MSFLNINSFQYSNLNKNNVSFNSIYLNRFILEKNIQYKLNVIKFKEIENFSTYSLTSDNIINGAEAKHPEKALTLSLPNGIYKIILISYGIYNKITHNFNDCIKSSKGKVVLSDFDFIDNQNNITSINEDNLKIKSINEFDFKMNKSGQFSIWIESESPENLIGNFNFYLIKLSNSNLKDEEENSYLFTKNTIENLNIPLEPNFLYKFETYKLVNNNSSFTPNFKYPDGTYQITLNEMIGSSSNDEILNNIMINDVKKFKLLNEKLENLNNILIPNEVNPLNYYYMIGKIEFLLYFDFITDTYFFQSVSHAECFMALYVPKSICKVMEQNDSYSIFKIVSYNMIYKDYNDQTKIKENIKLWLNVKDEDIHIDEYKIYYWIDIQNCDFNIFYNITNNLAKIKNFYVYVNLSILGNIYDNVSLQINEDNKLDWSLTNAHFNILEEPTNNINYINWEKISDWENYNNTQNLLYSNISGNGILKITKQRFKNATGINVDITNEGSLTIEQLKNLNINEPDLPIYNRFQYWLRTEKF